MLCAPLKPMAAITIVFALCANTLWAQETGKLDLEAAELTAELIGRPVFSIDGAEVGTVTDFALDETGEPRKLRMITDRGLGIGTRTVEVSSPSFMTLRGAVVLDLPASEVALLPAAPNNNDR